jgi:hypothetical protein
MERKDAQNACVKVVHDKRKIEGELQNHYYGHEQIEDALVE